MRERENFLVKKHEDLEAKLDKKIVSETPKYYKYIKTKGEWENIVKKDNGIILRSKAKWMEKKNKIFHKYEKREIMTKNKSTN